MDELILVPLSCRLAAWLMASCGHKASRAYLRGVGVHSAVARSPEEVAGDTLAVSRSPDLTSGELQGPAFVRRQLGP